MLIKEKWGQGNGAQIKLEFVSFDMYIFYFRLDIDTAIFDAYLEGICAYTYI